MTTKKFIIAERENNGEFARMSEYKTRQEATKVLAEIFTNDENADPQNFKILVEEVEVKTEAELMVEELVAKLKKYGDEWIVTQEEKRAHISRPCKMWTSAALMDIVEFMGRTECAGYNFYIDDDGTLVVYTRKF